MADFKCLHVAGVFANGRMGGSHMNKYTAIVYWQYNEDYREHIEKIHLLAKNEADVRRQMYGRFEVVRKVDVYGGYC